MKLVPEPRLASALSSLLVALVAAGCASLPGPMSTAAEVPESYKHAAAAPAIAETIDAAWWASLGDPTLATLIERATRDNTDIAQADARLAQALALIDQARSQQLPQVGSEASVERGREGLGAATQSRAGLGIGASFEVDLFGRLAGSSRAAALDAQGRQALLGATRVAVQAAVAQTYLALRATERELRLVIDTAAAYRDTLTLTERRFDAGDVAELDVARVRAELAATEADAQAMLRSRATLENALATLVGSAPAAFAIDEEAVSTPLKLPPVPAGLPSELLRRRADIVAAEFDLQAAQARLGVARSAWFPSLTMTASGGVASTDLSELLTRGARAWGVGALLALPIFDGGRREAGVQQAQGLLDEAHARHRADVLAALREVEDQLVALQTLREQSQAQGRAVASAERATALSTTRWRNGLVSQLELLDAQRSELRYRRAALQIEAAQQQAAVALVRSLGGGWAL